MHRLMLALIPEGPLLADEAGAGRTGSGLQAVPFSYGGSSVAAEPSAGAGGGYQAVGFSYGGGSAATGAAAEGGGGLSVPEGAAGQQTAAAAVPTVALEPFLPRFEVPAELEGCLPETERMHKVRCRAQGSMA